LQKRAKDIEQLGYQVFFVDITIDLAPVVLAAAVNKDSGPALVLGTASSLDILQACSKALSEVEQQLYWNLRSSVESYSLSDYRRVKRVSDHAALYHTPRYLAKASFLWSGGIQPLPYVKRSPGDELEEVLKILKSNDREVVVGDITPVFLKDTGIKVIKAMPAGLIPISFGYGMEPLGMSRLDKLPEKTIPFTHPFA